MTLTDEVVTDIENRIHGLPASRNATAADVEVAAKLTDQRWLSEQWPECLQRGLSPAESMAALDLKARSEYDVDTFAMGVQIEVDRDEKLAETEQRIARQRVLDPTIEPLLSRESRQLEELTALLIDEKLRAHMRDTTLRDASDRYKRANPDTQEGRRFIAWLEANVSTIEFKREDSAADALALMELKDAIEQRQRVRVDPKLYEWRDRLVKTRTVLSFTTMMQHLRDGRGIARRPPAQPTLRIV